jgi:hypothetical protein
MAADREDGCLNAIGLEIKLSVNVKVRSKTLELQVRQRSLQEQSTSEAGWRARTSLRTIYIFELGKIHRNGRVDQPLERRGLCGMIWMRMTDNN